jgi:hypothetical protein
MDDYEDGTEQGPVEDPPTDPELFEHGFRREFKEAVNDALIRHGVPVCETRVIKSIEVHRAGNPLHDYKVNF